MRFKLLLLILLILLSLISFIVLWQRNIIISRAQTDSVTSVNTKNTYTFCSPSIGKADCEQTTRCTIVVLNNAGLGVSGKSCAFSYNASIATKIIRGTSDTNGVCIIDFTSCKTGKYTLDVFVDGRKLSQSLPLFFE